MADLRIDLAAEFRGKKAFKEADTAVAKLNKNVKTLATTLGAAYGAKAVVNFGKATVKAFAADQAAAIKLTNAVKNLGMAYANPQISKFIQDLERSSGIVDDQLRPAFQALLTTTKDLGSSYALLNSAIDISRGTGIDLATVSQDLANGYIGITRGLKKYNLGLSQAELKSKNFLEIIKLLNKQYSGASAAYLDTYAGKLDMLTVASDNAKESIGKGLIDAFARLSGGSTTQDAVKNIEAITSAINGLITAVSVVIQGFVKLYKGLDFLTSFGGLTGANGKIVQKLKPEKTTSPQNTLAKSQIKASTTLTKAQKSTTAELKKQAALKKAGTVFDMEQIQLIAALKGKLSDEERLRVQAQLAILNENDALASQLTKQILMAQDATGGLYKYFLSIGDAKIKNPFAFLDQWLLDFQKKLNDLFSQTNTSGGGGGGTRYTTSSISQTVSSNPLIQDAFNQVQAFQLANGANSAEAAALALDSARYTALGQSYAGYSASAPVINVTVQGSVIKEQELIAQIQNGTQLASLSGSPSQIGRIAGMFG